MGTQAQYVLTPKSPRARVTVANANLDGTGAIIDIHTAGANGARIDDITIKAEVTTTLGMIRFYIWDTTNYRLIHEEPVAAVTKSATVAAFEVTLRDLAWLLQAGYKLAASTEKGEAIMVQVTRGGDL